MNIITKRIDDITYYSPNTESISVCGVDKIEGSSYGIAYYVQDFDVDLNAWYNNPYYVLTGEYVDKDGVDCGIEKYSEDLGECTPCGRADGHIVDTIAEAVEIFDEHINWEKNRLFEE
jgi:hypothetical protein